MTSLWIVHRHPRIRSAIVRLAAAGEDTIVGGPGDPLFDAAPAPDVVLLGLVGDFEAELQFAHRVAGRLHDARWILLPEHPDVPRARFLFDTLDAEVLSYPPDAGRLRRELLDSAPPLGDAPLPLSQRPFRDALRDRFSRWFADLDSAELLRALDPRLADVPLLIVGERGTGRALLAHYLHTFGGTGAGAFAQVACSESTTAEGAAAEIARASAGPRGRAACTVWLEDADRLRPEVQRQIQSWIEFGAPAGTLRTAQSRWIASATDLDALEPGLGRVFGALRLGLPPVRERPHRVAGFANDTTQAWCRAHGQAPRRFGEDAVAVLEEYPWPGNLRELETVVTQTLAAGTADPVRADDLLYDGRPFAPLGPAEHGETDEAGGEKVDAPAWTAPTLRPEEQAKSETEDEPEALVELIPEDEPEALVELIPEDEAPTGDTALRRLAASVAHEVRNPLATIQAFAQLLPERYDDAEFRSRFADLVNRDVRRISEVVDGLGQLAALKQPVRATIDLTALLEELLAAQRDAIRHRRLLVLQELETERPQVLVDPDQIRFAFTSLLDRSLRLVPERGDLYLASRYHETGLRGGPSVRVLVRLQLGGAGAKRPVEGTTPAENALELAIAETVVRSQGGAFAIDAGDSETVIIIDLPAPA